MTNFDHLTRDPRIAPFATIGANGERIFQIDPSACAMNCRRAMEFAIKWMYTVDGDLVMPPYENTLFSLMNTLSFKEIVPSDLLTRMHFIRSRGNDSAHNASSLTKQVAAVCLENLYVFLDFVSCCYGENYEERSYDKSVLTFSALSTSAEAPLPKGTLSTSAEAPLPKGEAVALALPLGELSAELTERAFHALQKENQSLKAELTARRAEQSKDYIPKPLDLTEYHTRKLYIDTMLQDAGWQEGTNWVNEVNLQGMPNASGEGYADYVLYGDDGKALAVIEAKRTCVSVEKGRQQAKLYADLLEQKQGRRPVIFLTNGFESRIVDGQYPERSVATIYSKRDLEKLFNLRHCRTSLAHINVNDDIAGRYYQEGAIRAVCERFDMKNRRKALLVMATGSGKTRTVIALSDVLLQHGWVKNILFLADRNALVTQAKRAFVNLLPDLSTANLAENKADYHAHCIFSTYQTMMHCIDSVSDEQGKLYTPGHFDLIICDEAHRSIYNKFRDIFTYFDAPLVGLTATPKDEIDKNTYEIFELENGLPTYGYELAQAVKDGYLVDFLSVETTLKFLHQGICYEELSDADKVDFEETFGNTDGEIPEQIAASALNQWVFNEDTIRKVLHTLMTEGLHVEYGKKVGKTIIFAKNHDHAEKIYEIFGKEYPHLKDYAMVIDNYINYAQRAIDEFSKPQKLPQIAISVDMLDTGIDVPEVLNLVFFKKVMSKAKFRQMIGRGTRLCPELLDDEDKGKFYIFDFCGNFEFFRMHKGRPTANALALQGAIFNLKVHMAFHLQDLAYQTSDLIAFREGLVRELVNKVQSLDTEHFAVHQHLRNVEKFAKLENYQTLSDEDTILLKEHIAPLVLPEADEATALRFDALICALELACLVGKAYNRGRSDLLGKVQGVASVANIPEIRAQSDLIQKILTTDYVERAGIFEFEHIRTHLRHLMKYITRTDMKYSTNFTDAILSIEWKESDLENDDLKNYRERAEFYIRQHQEAEVICKLKTNLPLTKEDIAQLESILWSELGTQEEYQSACGDKPLGEFVREIVGLDMNAAKEAFAIYLNDSNLDARQIYFVNQIVEYIVHNGVMRDLSILQEPPFSDKGSVVEIFTDLSIWMGIKHVIDGINANVAA